MFISYCDPELITELHSNIKVKFATEKQRQVHAAYKASIGISINEFRRARGSLPLEHRLWFLLLSSILLIQRHKGTTYVDYHAKFSRF